MGIISQLFGLGKTVTNVAEVFRENTEAQAVRAADLQQTAMAQYAAEFAPRPKGPFDKFMDGINRLPRPALALGTLDLFVAAMTDPVWFASRMDGLATVPEPLWWLLGAIVSFYFGARHQLKGQEFRKTLLAARREAPAAAAGEEDPTFATDPNAAVEAWRQSQR